MFTLTSGLNTKIIYKGLITLGLQPIIMQNTKIIMQRILSASTEAGQNQSSRYQVNI